MVGETALPISLILPVILSTSQKPDGWSVTYAPRTEEKAPQGESDHRTEDDRSLNKVIEVSFFVGVLFFSIPFAWQLRGTSKLHAQESLNPFIHCLTS